MKSSKTAVASIALAVTLAILPAASASAYTTFSGYKNCTSSGLQAQVQARSGTSTVHNNWKHSPSSSPYRIHRAAVGVWLYSQAGYNAAYYLTAMDGSTHATSCVYF